MTTSPRTLLVYYSRTGTTRKLAELIAAQVPCDVDELVDNHDRSGVLGYLRSGFQALVGNHTHLKPTLHDPADYDLVIVGTPKWVNVSTPVRTYLAEHAGRFKQVAFFLTQQGLSGRAMVFRQMAGLCGRRPVATLAVREGEIATGQASAEVLSFVAALARGTEAAATATLVSLGSAP